MGSALNSKFDNTSASTHEQVVQNVLEGVVQTIVTRTPYRRALATCFEQAVKPDSAASTSKILSIAAAGMSEESVDELRRAVEHGTRVSGERYVTSSALSRSFFYPEGVGLSHSSVIVPSTRHFLTLNGWTQSDVLLVPFWLNGEIIGQISIDDPMNGLRPQSSALMFLEEIASVAARSLQDACHLEKLTETHRLFQFLADSGVTGVLVVQDDQIVYSNDQAAEILGFAGDELTSMSPWWSFLHPDDRPFAWRCIEAPQYSSRTIRAIRKDGREVWLSAYGHHMQYKQEAAVACQFYDISDRISTENQLIEKAMRDPLTGLRNRAYFNDTIQLELSRSRRYKRSFTLMMADLRGFKIINDTLGHQEGDRILIGIACVLRDQLRDSDWIVRYGGDEFLFVLPETESELAVLVDRLETSVADWGRENAASNVEVAIDFGWAMWSPDDSRTITELIQAADLHLYEQKNSRKSQQFVEPTVSQESI